MSKITKNIYCMMVIIILVTLCSCAGLDYKVSNSTGDYKTVELEDEICHYSVELPPGYEPDRHYIETTYGFYYSDFTVVGPPHYLGNEEADVIFALGPGGGSGGRIKYYPISMNINIGNPRDPPYTPFMAKDQVEKQITNLTNTYKTRAEVLYYIERAPVTVAGIEGIQITYNDLPPLAVPPLKLVPST
jgi:hypothetical protein